MKKSILVAALAVVGAGAFFTPSAQAHDHHGWGNPYYGGGWGNPYYTNRSGFFRDTRHERREIRRDERRAVRHWDHRLNRWF